MVSVKTSASLGRSVFSSASNAALVVGSGTVLEVAAPSHCQHHRIDQLASVAEQGSVAHEDGNLEHLALEEAPRLAQAKPGQAGVARPVGFALFRAGGADAQVHGGAAVNERRIAHQSARTTAQRRLGGYALIGEGGEALLLEGAGSPLGHPCPRLLEEPLLQDGQFPALGKQGAMLIDDANVHEQMRRDLRPVPSCGSNVDAELAFDDGS